MAEPTFKAPKGTRDILPPESGRRRALIDAFAQQAELAGFGEIMSPIFEDLGVFKRLGESTDVVTKEMFDFFDKGDPPQHLALRPELTASVCRAFAEHRTYGAEDIGALVALVGRQAGLGLAYWVALGVAVLLIAWEFALARHRDREACFRAFRHNHWIGAAVFAGIAAHYALG